MIEVAKALSLNANLLIMDEPTSALTETEINSIKIRQLERLARDQAKQGTSQPEADIRRTLGVLAHSPSLRNLG